MSGILRVRVDHSHYNCTQPPEPLSSRRYWLRRLSESKPMPLIKNVECSAIQATAPLRHVTYAPNNIYDTLASGFLRVA